MISSEDLLIDEVFEEVNESLAPQRPPEEDEEDATGTLIDLGANADDEVWFKCGDGEALLTVELQTDKHGDDVSWTLVLSNYSDETSGPSLTAVYEKGGYCWGVLLRPG